MERETLLKLYNRLTGFVEKLPGGLQKPILRELVPIRETFLESRPARVLLLGNGTIEPAAFLQAIGIEGAAPAGIVDNGWRTFSSNQLGAIELLDARRVEPPPEYALERMRPDVLVWLQGGEAASPADLASAAALLDGCPADIPLVAWAEEGPAAARAAAAVSAEKQLSSRGGRVFHDREKFA
ncbi:MAG: hypothetical protein N2322_08020, partial [Terrimicrobiaceae bacterium]|nr:hypothetical protein [Terrimicrobiaceae bacterium]